MPTSYTFQLCYKLKYTNNGCAIPSSQKRTMSDLREYAISAYFRVFLPHISRFLWSAYLKKNCRVFLTCLSIAWWRAAFLKTSCSSQSDWGRTVAEMNFGPFWPVGNCYHQMLVWRRGLLLPSVVEYWMKEGNLRPGLWFVVWLMPYISFSALILTAVCQEGHLADRNSVPLIHRISLLEQLEETRRYELFVIVAEAVCFIHMESVLEQDYFPVNLCSTERQLKYSPNVECAEKVCVLSSANFVRSLGNQDRLLPNSFLSPLFSGRKHLQFNSTFFCGLGALPYMQPQHRSVSGSNDPNRGKSVINFFLSTECSSFDQTRHQYYSLLTLKISSVTHPSKIYSILLKRLTCTISL